MVVKVKPTDGHPAILSTNGLTSGTFDTAPNQQSTPRPHNTAAAQQPSPPSPPRLTTPSPSTARTLSSATAPTTFPPLDSSRQTLIATLATSPTTTTVACRLANISPHSFDRWMDEAQRHLQTIADLSNPNDSTPRDEYINNLSQTTLDKIQLFEDVNQARNRYRIFAETTLHRQLLTPHDKGGGVRQRTFKEIIVRDKDGDPILDPSTNQPITTTLLINEKVSDAPQILLKLLAQLYPDEWGQQRVDINAKVDVDNTTNTTANLAHLVSFLTPTDQALLVSLLEKAMALASGQNQPNEQKVIDTATNHQED